MTYLWWPLIIALIASVFWLTAQSFESIADTIRAILTRLALGSFTYFVMFWSLLN